MQVTNKQIYEYELENHNISDLQSQLYADLTRNVLSLRISYFIFNVSNKKAQNGSQSLMRHGSYLIHLIGTGYPLPSIVLQCTIDA